MKLALVLFSVLLAMPLFGAGEVDEGDTVPNMCWQDSAGKETCLYEPKDKVLVLFYTTPTCQSCIDAMPQFVQRAQALAGQPVAFFNLVSQGDKDGDAPSTAVLKAWQSRFSIPFTVAASPFDAGSVFFFQAKAPVVAVVGKTKDRELKYSNDEINLDEIFDAVQKAIAEKPAPPM